MSGLQIEGLTKRYKGDVVLDDVSLSVPSGDTLALFGPSGAGKTVLLRCIAGAVDPDAGRIVIDGEDVTDAAPERRAVGMAFQNFALFPHMSAFDNIGAALTARREGKSGLRRKVEEVATLLKIDHVLGHAPRALSNGQKQRTALARAMVGQPKLLLLDDPLRNVDAKLRFEMRLELPRLLAERGTTVVYVTQDYKEAMALGDRIAVLVDGRIVQNGTPEDVYDRPADTRIAGQFGDPAINMLDVVPTGDEDGLHVMVSERRIRLPDGYRAADGRDCVLGLRPESLSFAEEGVAVEIEAETPFNEKTVTLCLTRNGREILVSRPAGTPGPASGIARIAVDFEAALLFDRATGRRIPRDGERENVRDAA